MTGAVAATLGVRVVTVPNLDSTHTVVDPLDAQASCAVQRAGTTLIRGSAGPDWITAPHSTVGDGFWVRVTMVSGTLTTGTVGSWTQISSDQTWTKSQTVVGLSTCTFTLEIARDSAGVQIVSSRNITFNAEVSP